MRTCIHNARILLPEGELYQGDLLITDGRIAAIDRDLLGSSALGIDQVVAADGLVLMPGVMDPQVHFREPGKEHKEDLHTASRACVRGGVTSFLEMPNTDPLTINQATLDDKLQRASQKSLVNYGFFIGATGDNLTDLQTVKGACGIKIFMGSMGGPLLVEDQEALEAIFAQTDPNFVIAVHAEDQAMIRARREQFATQMAAGELAIHSQIQNVEVALTATKRALDLAIRHRHRLHILHLSTAAEVDLLRQHKPAWVTAEVTPQHLHLSTDHYATLRSLAQMNPPLRDPDNAAGLWQGLQDGILDCIATDHAPHTLTEKAQPYPHSPSGMPGVETALPLMLTAAQQGRCTLAQVMGWMCELPPRLYGIPYKGRIEVGYDADLILVDLDRPRLVKREDLETKCGWSPFEGWSLVGWPQWVWVNGQAAMRQGILDDTVRGLPLRYQRDQRN